MTYRLVGLILIVFFPFFLFSQKTGIKDTIFINRCDTGTHGLTVINLDSIKYNLFTNAPTIIPAVYIGNGKGQVIKITNLNSSPTIVNICENLNYSWTDIAINKNQEKFVCTTNAIYKMNAVTGSVQLFHQFGANTFLIALSFDTKNNLYCSNGSIVYRFNNSTGSPVIWHDFGTGSAGGDFVMKGNKMYIAWNLLNEFRLYEVTVDNNINFVSYTNLCLLKNRTFGLASELGQLYGITTSELYLINTSNCSLSTVITNTTGANWNGAAGLHEAQNSISAHINYTDATTLTNEIKGQWTNTIPYNQLIYISLDDKYKDSLFIYPVKIKIIPKSIISVNKTICKGSTYSGYSVSGTYVDYFKNSAGCDSIRTLNLKVVDKFLDTIKAAICNGEMYRGYTNSGVYTEKYTTIEGCDSFIVLILKVNSTSTSTITKTICEGKRFLNRTKNGIYIDTLKNYLGCDSFRTLNLTVVSITKPLIDVYKCILLGQKIVFLTKTITQPGIYIDSTSNIETCDTIYRINVSLITPEKKYYKKIACQELYFKGNFYNEDTVLVDTIKNVLGCDSIYFYTDLKIQKLINQETITINYCDTFTFKNKIYTSDTTIIDIIKYTEAPFCDSLKQIYRIKKLPKPIISINAPQGTICTKGDSIVLKASGGEKYLWNTSQTNATLIITPTINQIYTLKGWDKMNCVDSTSIFINVEELVDFDLPSAFSPNGDGINDIWKPNANGKYEIVLFEIFNRWGEKIFSGSNLQNGWDGMYKNMMQSNGIYTYQIIFIKNRKIVEKKGSITLVR